MNNLRLWENSLFENFADVIIYFNGVEYKLNKQILSVSSTLKNLLLGGYEESFKNEINLDIREINVESWELMLNYIYDKYTEFYKQIFELDIRDYTVPDISTLNLEQMVELYITSDYFDIPVLTDKLQTLIVDILSNLLKTNDVNLDSISSLIEYLPSNSIINSLLDKLEIHGIIQVMSLCKNNRNYFCNNIIFPKLQQLFDIPNSVSNLYELNMFLKERKIELSNYFSSLYIFTDSYTEDLLLNYILLKYPNSSLNQLNSINNLINISIPYKNTKPPKISIHRRIRKSSLYDFDTPQSSSTDIRKPIDRNVVFDVITLDFQLT